MKSRSAADAATVKRITQQIVEYFVDGLGLPPIGRLTVNVVDQLRAHGVSTPGVVTVLTSKLGKDELYTNLLLAHEIAHQWWGCGRPYPPLAHDLHEVLAEYFAHLWVEAALGSDAAMLHLRILRGFILRYAGTGQLTKLAIITSAFLCVDRCAGGVLHSDLARLCFEQGLGRDTRAELQRHLIGRKLLQSWFEFDASKLPAFSFDKRMDPLPIDGIPLLLSEGKEGSPLLMLYDDGLRLSDRDLHLCPEQVAPMEIDNSTAELKLAYEYDANLW